MLLLTLEGDGGIILALGNTYVIISTVIQTNFSCAYPGVTIFEFTVLDELEEGSNKVANVTL